MTCSVWNGDASTRIFLALEIRERAHRCPHIESRRAGEKQAGADQTPVGADGQERPGELRIRDDFQGMRLVAESTRCAQKLEALVNADQELRRSDPDLDRAKLRAFDHARNGAELTGRVKLRREATAAVLADHGGEAFHPLVLRIVERGGGELDGHRPALRDGASASSGSSATAVTQVIPHARNHTLPAKPSFLRPTGNPPRSCPSSVGEHNLSRHLCAAHLQNIRRGASHDASFGASKHGLPAGWMHRSFGCGAKPKARLTLSLEPRRSGRNPAMIAGVPRWAVCLLSRFRRFAVKVRRDSLR